MIKIKENYLYQDGKPFFWLADTAWLLFEKLSLEEIKHYLDDRKKLGFTVIQCVLLHTYDPVLKCSCSGKNPNKLEYWKTVKLAVDYAEELGLIMGILPAWGAMVKSNIIHEKNMNQYVTFLLRLFRENDNIVWILGGDIRGDEYFSFFDSLGKKLKHENPNRLITFHPFGRTASYLWFNDCEWLDFHMFQSGHRRYDQIQMNAWDDKKAKEDVFGEDNYKYVIKNKSMHPCKPCLDGEPSYEGILQGLHDISQPYWQAKDVRRYAYWSVLEGACGFTYGNNAVMQFYRKGDSGSYGVREEWQDALHMPGGMQMHYLKDLLESVKYTEGHARADLVVDPKPYYEHISCFVGNDYIICYTFLGKPFTLNLKEFVAKKYKGYWMNPENGVKTSIGDVVGGSASVLFQPDEVKLENDWVLLLVVEDEKFNTL